MNPTPLRLGALLTALLCAPALAPVAAADGFAPPPPAENLLCVNTSTGYVACGAVAVAPGSAAVGVGVATGFVDWELVLEVTSWSQTYTATTSGPAAALAVFGHYTTSSCVRASLYADGTLVDETLWIC